MLTNKRDSSESDDNAIQSKCTMVGGPVYNWSVSKPTRNNRNNAKKDNDKLSVKTKQT
jgi:hypothetical protein